MFIAENIKGPHLSHPHPSFPANEKKLHLWYTSHDAINSFSPNKLAMGPQDFLLWEADLQAVAGSPFAPLWPGFGFPWATGRPSFPRSCGAVSLSAVT